jgi:hypothetical protein
VLRSLRRLVFSPGFLTREHVEGRRAAWVSPLKLYLLTSVAAFAMLAIAGDDGGLRIDVTGVPRAAVDDARSVWLPRVLFVLVPFFAWLVSRVRRSSGRHYPSHLVFALHFHAAAFAVRAVMSAASLVLPAAAAPWLNSVVLIYVLVALPLALRTAYGVPRGRAIRDGLVAGLLYWFVALVAVGVAVTGAIVLPRWLASRGFWLAG